MTSTTTEKQYIYPSLGVGVEYWMRDTSLPASESYKIKQLDFHPTKPILMMIDQDNKLSIWNYNLQKFLLKESVSETINSSDHGINYKAASADSLFVRSGRRTSIDDQNDSSKFGRPESTGKQRQSSKVSNCKVSFADPFFVQFSLGFPYEEIDNHNILVIADHLLVFDYVTRATMKLSETDLKSGTTVTCAEFIHYKFCAVGCSDGVVRIWNPSQSAVVKSLTGHSKGGIQFIKAIPVKSHERGVPDKTRIRMLTIGSDGQALVWDMFVNKEGGLEFDASVATARLKDSIMSNVPGYSNSNVLYDFESNTVTIASNDKIRVWDLVDMCNAARHSTSLRRHSTAPRRGSLFGGNADAYGDIFAISCVNSIKGPEKGFVVESLANMTHPCFPSNCYVVCSKGNSFGIYESNEAAAGDEKSERSSVVTGSDKPQRLLTLSTFTLSSLMEDYVAKYEKFFPEDLKALAVSESVKIYCLRVHPTQPHLVALGTSMGFVVVSFPRYPTEEISGSHAAWGLRNMVFQESHVRLVDYDFVKPGSRGSRGESARMDTVSFAAAEDSSGNPLEALEPHTEVVAEHSMDENKVLDEIVGISDTKKLLTGSARKSMTGGPGSLGGPRKSMLFTSMLYAGNSIFHMKPSFLPSPTGDFCIVFWPDMMLYIVLAVEISEESGSGEEPKSKLHEIERGRCLEIAWASKSDFFLLKTPCYVTTSTAKPRRQSMMGAIFGGTKELRKWNPSTLVLKQCMRDAAFVKTHLLQLPPRISADSVYNLFSGGALNINFRSNFTPSASVAASSASGDSGKDPAVVAEAGEDVDKMQAEYLKGYHSLSTSILSKFFFVMSTNDLRLRQAELAKEEAAAAKSKKKGKKEKEDVGEEAAAAEGSSIVHTDGYSLVPIDSVVMSQAELVSWDYRTSFCAVLCKYATSIGVYHLRQLSRDGQHAYELPDYDMVPVSSVCVASSINKWHLSLYSAHWHHGVLLVNNNSTLQMIALPLQDGKLSNAPEDVNPDVVTYDILPAYSNWAQPSIMDSLTAEMKGQAVFSPTAWSAVLKLQVDKGVVVLANKDGSIRPLSLARSIAGQLILKSLAEDKNIADVVEGIDKRRQDEQEQVASILLKRECLEEAKMLANGSVCENYLNLWS